MQHQDPTGLLRWFAYAHLPPHLQVTSKKFYDLAADLVGEKALATGAVDVETHTMLRKLLEAKDCAVRAVLDAARGHGSDT